MKATKATKKKPAAKKVSGRTSHLERAARKAMRYLSDMKLARALGDETMPQVSEIQRIEHALAEAISETKLRAAVLLAAEFVGRTVQGRRPPWTNLH